MTVQRYEWDHGGMEREDRYGGYVQHLEDYRSLQRAAADLLVYLDEHVELTT